MRRLTARILIGAFVAASTAEAQASGGVRAVDRGAFVLVVANGRVVDPETGLDGIRSIGISNGRIQAISRTPLRGRTVLDASGLVVAPGFIDLHSHGQ
ncbi:MAG: D-glutamate deacylase, partial [Gemmatimonadota bacterium]|nr:D-glutamate deacylase [Gemmatimonadota bacterium]